MRIRIRLRQSRGCIGAGERKGDEDGGSWGQSAVLREIVGRAVGVEFEFVGAVAAGGGGGCVGDVFGFEEGDQEGGGPAGAEDEELHLWGLEGCIGAASLGIMRLECDEMRWETKGNTLPFCDEICM